MSRHLTRTRARAALLAVAILLLPLGVALGGETGESPGSWGSVDRSEKPADTPELRARGKQIFTRACSYCHGLEGKGDGAAAHLMVTKPRNFTLGSFKIRSTPSGSLPLDEDLYATITAGFPAYSMPRFAHLSPIERWALVFHIKTLSEDFAEDEVEAPVALTQDRPATPESIARGKVVYTESKCWQCHGKTGRGDGPSADALEDARGRPSPSLNFALGARYFKRGFRALDIVNTFRTGVDGTGMPEYIQNINEDDSFALAHYVLELARGGE